MDSFYQTNYFRTKALKDRSTRLISEAFFIKGTLHAISLPQEPTSLPQAYRDILECYSLSARLI